MQQPLISSFSSNDTQQAIAWMVNLKKISALTGLKGQDRTLFYTYSVLVGNSLEFSHALSRFLSFEGSFRDFIHEHLRTQTDLKIGQFQTLLQIQKLKANEKKEREKAEKETQALIKKLQAEDHRTQLKRAKKKEKKMNENDECQVCMEPTYS
jgi:hypothetical protein